MHGPRVRLQVGVFMPSVRRCYLNITPANVVRVHHKDQCIAIASFVPSDFERPNPAGRHPRPPVIPSPRPPFSTPPGPATRHAPQASDDLWGAEDGKKARLTICH
jgi:hypothetical protein